MFTVDVKQQFKIHILHNVLNVVYRTTLSIRTERTDKTVKALFRLLLEEQSDQGLHYLSFYLLHLHNDTARKTQTVQL